MQWPLHLAHDLDESCWVQEGQEGEDARMPPGVPEPACPVRGVPGPLSHPSCNQEMMSCLILYLPRMPVIFYLSESNLLMTFLPDVA